MTTITSEFTTKIEGFLAALQKLSDDHYAANFKHITGPVFSAKYNPSYVRIIRTETFGSGRSVHCFIDYDGNILKAAGWKAPAKGIRGTLDDENFSVGKGVGVYGAAYFR